MIKKLMRLGTLAGVSLAALVSPAAADPISMALVTAIGFTAGTTAFGIAVAVVDMAIGAALNYGISLFSKATQKKPQQVVGGISTEVQSGVEVYRQICFGRCALAGTFRYFKGVGASNKEAHLVYSLSDWECEGLTGIWVNGARKSLQSLPTVGTEDARYTVEGFDQNMVVKFFSGKASQVADSELVAAALDTQGQTVAPLTSAAKGFGVCYVSLKLTFDQDLYQGGMPTFLFEVKGAKLYDPRKDTTAGGSGPHRWNDPTTWEYSANPAVCALNYCLGFYRNGVRLLGKGDRAVDLLMGSFIAAMNVCDETVVDGGVVGPRYDCSVIATDEAEHRTALEAFRVAMAGDIVEASGITGIYAGASQVPVLTLTDDDLAADGSFTYGADITDGYNAVSAKWTNPAIQWQFDDLPMLANVAWESDDGGERLVKELELRSVSRLGQAARIQKIAHEQSRMTVTTTGTFRPGFNVLEPGDWVTRVFNRKGFPTVTMKVVNVSRAASGWVTLTLRQAATANYVPPAALPISSPPVTVTPHVVTAVLAGFALGTESIESAGQARPVLHVGWTPPSDPSVVAVQMECRLLNNVASTRSYRAAPADSGLFTIADDVMAASTYEVRIRPEYNTGGTGTWTAWGQVLTTSYFAVMSARIAHDTQNILGANWATYTDDALANALEQAERYLADIAVAERSAKDVLAVSDAGNTVAASVVQERLARISADSAIASIADAANATANGATAGSLFRVQAEASPVGALARISAQVRVSTSGTAQATTFKDAGWFLEVFDSGGGIYKGRMVVAADQFAIKTSGTPFVPFLVSGSDVYIQSLVMGGTLRSANYVAGQSGFAINADGTAEFQNAVVGGGSSTKLPFSMAFGFHQDGVFSDEAVGVVNERVEDISAFYGAGQNYHAILSGTVRRAPTGVEYDMSIDLPDNDGTSSTIIRRVFSSKQTAARGKGMPWAPHRFMARILKNVNAGAGGFLWDENGNLFVKYQKSTIGGLVVNSKVLVGTALNAADADPMSELEYSSTDIVVIKDTFISGIRRRRVPATVKVSGVPTPVVGVRAWLWGAAGQGMATTIAGTTIIPGGPGGFVKNDIAVQPGEILSLMVGNSFANGLGGFGRVDTSTSGTASPLFCGGGGSFLWRGAALRENLLAVAGGGGTANYSWDGAAYQQIAGAPGGSVAFGGGNNASYTDMRRCMGFSEFGEPLLTGAIIPGGGGGYEGGGKPSGSWHAGRGGTNFVKTPLINSANQAAAENATHGAATTLTAPGTAETVYTANKTYPNGRADVGCASSTLNMAGHGMICLQWLTSL